MCHIWERPTDLEYIILYIWIMYIQDREHIIIDIYKFCHVLQNINLSLDRKLMNILSLSVLKSSKKQKIQIKVFTHPLKARHVEQTSKHVTCA